MVRATARGSDKQVQCRMWAMLTSKHTMIFRKVFCVRWLMAASGDGVLSAAARCSGLGRCRSGWSAPDVLDRVGMVTSV
eukprot:6475850-Amphidinium_carterae.1